MCSTDSIMFQIPKEVTLSHHIRDNPLYYVYHEIVCKVGTKEKQQNYRHVHLR